MLAHKHESCCHTSSLIFPFPGRLRGLCHQSWKPVCSQVWGLTQGFGSRVAHGSPRNVGRSWLPDLTPAYFIRASPGQDIVDSNWGQVHRHGYRWWWASLSLFPHWMKAGVRYDDLKGHTQGQHITVTFEKWCDFDSFFVTDFKSNLNKLNTGSQ